MWKMIWPIALVVVSNCMYNICTKSTPSQANAFLSLSVTYLIAAVFSLLIFLFTPGKGTLGAELKQLNWTALVLGIVIVGLEIGYICIYRAGWNVSIGSLVANIWLACALLFIGLLLYHESISPKQIIGIVICAFGLFLVCK